MSQYDELRLATSRMRYMTPSELTDGGGTADTSAVHPMFWTVKKDVFESERVLAWNELTRSLGQVVYLKNLAKVRVCISSIAYLGNACGAQSMNKAAKTRQISMLFV